MAERREPSVLHQLVGPEWFTTTTDTEAGNEENMEAFIDQLLAQAEIPKFEAPPAETPAVTEPVQACPQQFIQASDQDLQRLMNKHEQEHAEVYQYVGKKV